MSSATLTLTLTLTKGEYYNWFGDSKRLLGLPRDPNPNPNPNPNPKP